MVLVPAGPYWHPPAEGVGPDSRRELPVFVIDRTEVTIGEYGAYIASLPSERARRRALPYHMIDSAQAHDLPYQWRAGGRPPDAPWDRYPITQIAAVQAVEFSIWAGKRRVTKAEWVKAGRGIDQRPNPWGREEPSASRCNARLGGASPYGCLDLLGNINE